MHELETKLALEQRWRLRHSGVCMNERIAASISRAAGCCRRLILRLPLSVLLGTLAVGNGIFVSCVEL